MYTRAMPYAFGMYAGYLHVRYPTYDFTKGTFIYELIALVCYIGWSFIGCMPLHTVGFTFMLKTPASV